MIPWRVKNFISDRFPLVYHLVVNAGVKGNSAEHWDRRLEETWDDPIRNWPTKDRMIAELTRPADRVIDIACGNGGVLRYLKAHGWTDLNGLEISDYATRRLGAEGITMHHGVLPDIPLPDASFDVVIASQVLEHIIRRDRFAAEIARILRPGGQALIFVPDDCLGPIDEPEHCAKYTAESLRRFLGRHFQVESVESFRDENHPAMPVLMGRARRRA